MAIRWNKIKDVDICNEWWIYWLYVNIKQMVILKSYNITFNTFYKILFICEEDDIKILRNEDEGYNCGR